MSNVIPGKLLRPFQIPPYRTRPLDGISDLTGVFSLKRLLLSYKGPCIRIRRDQDDVETDIGFTKYPYPETVDMKAISDFLAASSPASTSAFVTIWYDQSGNSNNATIASASETNQATVGVSDGLNAIILDGGDHFVLPVAVLGSTIPDITSFVVSKVGTNATQERMWTFAASGATKVYMEYSGIISGQVGFGKRNDILFPLVTTCTRTNYNIFTAYSNGTGKSFQVNNGTPVTDSLGEASVTGIDAARISGTTGGAVRMTGSMIDMIFANSKLSDANILAINTYLGAANGITIS